MGKIDQYLAHAKSTLRKDKEDGWYTTCDQMDELWLAWTQSGLSEEQRSQLYEQLYGEIDRRNERQRINNGIARGALVKRVSDGEITRYQDILANYKCFVCLMDGEAYLPGDDRRQLNKEPQAKRLRWDIRQYIHLVNGRREVSFSYSYQLPVPLLRYLKLTWLRLKRKLAALVE